MEFTPDSDAECQIFVKERGQQESVYYNDAESAVIDSSHLWL